MKRILLVLAICLLVISLLCADGMGTSRIHTAREAVIVDSLMAVDQLSGSIYYQQNYITVDANWMEGETYIGDYYDMGWMVRFASIGYLTFELPIIPYGYELQSARLMMYIGSMRGNTAQDVYPIFDYGNTSVYPEGILEHIDYGDTYNSIDVIPSSIYASFTFFSNETLAPPCWVSHDVTDCLLMDFATNRTLTQYRIYLTGFSDWDNRDDYIATTTDSSPYNPYAPKIVYVVTDGASNNDPYTPQPLLTISCYPNPFSEISTITIKASEPGYSKLSIYNTKGQLIRTYGNNAGKSGDQTYHWDGRDEAGKQVSAGVYIVDAKLGNTVAKTRILYLK